MGVVKGREIRGVLRGLSSQGLLKVNIFFLLPSLTYIGRCWRHFGVYRYDIFMKRDGGSLPPLPYHIPNVVCNMQ